MKRRRRRRGHLEKMSEGTLRSRSSYLADLDFQGHMTHLVHPWSRSLERLKNTRGRGEERL